MLPRHLPTEVEVCLDRMSDDLNCKVAGRLVLLMFGILFAKGRRTVASWLRAAAIGVEFRLYYYTLGSVGRKVESLASTLLLRLLKSIPLGDYVLLAIDDTPTKRYGPRVEGAGIHHNPTPGPTGNKFLYGHVWVTLALIVVHPAWGVVALPLLACMYVRFKNLKSIAPHNRPAFQTKLEMAAELLKWAVPMLKSLGKPIRVVVDGGYVRRTFLKAAASLSVTVIGRLRKDAALFSVPVKGPARRGRKRKYGKNRISLAKRAGHRQGWLQGEFLLYGETVTKKYKTFLAAYPPASGLIRVVLVKMDDGFLPLLSTDPNLTAKEILEDYARRNAIEQTFKDLKEVYGAAQQQVRHWFASIAAFNMNAWMYALTEQWAWHRPQEELCGSRSPWDDADRRPSHADRRNAMKRHCLREQFSAIWSNTPMPAKIRSAVEAILAQAM